MNMILLVAVGGAVGSVARYLMASSIQKATGWDFPLGTVLVNILGCFLIGVLYVLLVARPDPRKTCVPADGRSHGGIYYLFQFFAGDGHDGYGRKLHRGDAQRCNQRSRLPHWYYPRVTLARLT